MAEQLELRGSRGRWRLREIKTITHCTLRSLRSSAPGSERMEVQILREKKEASLLEI